MTRIFCPSRRHLLDVLAAALILGLASKARAQGVSTLKIARSAPAPKAARWAQYLPSWAIR